MHAPTPHSEPIPAEHILSISKVTTIFSSNLLKTSWAKKSKAPLSPPIWFSDSPNTQRAMLEKAAWDAGINILQLLDEAAAAAATMTTDVWSTDLQADHTQLILTLTKSLIYSSNPPHVCQLKPRHRLT